MNGHDFTPETEETLFTFIGSRTVLSYWPYIIGLLLGVLALIALIMCCTAMGSKVIPEESNLEAERHRRGAPGDTRKPHTLRDEMGFYRTRGYFPEPSPQLDPAGRPRNSLLPRNTRQSVYPSPKPAGH
jgi:hypothetical protein